MIVDHFNLCVLAIILIVGLLLARGAKRKFGNFKSLLAATGLKKSYANDRMFENLRAPAFKKCPNCAAQLQLSALICVQCDFNFLAGPLSRGNKLLLPPDGFADQGSKPKIAAGEV